MACVTGLESTMRRVAINTTLRTTTLPLIFSPRTRQPQSTVAPEKYAKHRSMFLVYSHTTETCVQQCGGCPNP